MIVVKMLLCFPTAATMAGAFFQSLLAVEMLFHFKTPWFYCEFWAVFPLKHQSLQMDNCIKSNTADVWFYSHYPASPWQQLQLLPLLHPELSDFDLGTGVVSMPTVSYVGRFSCLFLLAQKRQREDRKEMVKPEMQLKHSSQGLIPVQLDAIFAPARTPSEWWRQYPVPPPCTHEIGVFEKGFPGK